MDKRDRELGQRILDIASTLAFNTFDVFGFDFTATKEDVDQACSEEKLKVVIEKWEDIIKVNNSVGDENRIDFGYLTDMHLKDESGGYHRKHEKTNPFLFQNKIYSDNSGAMAMFQGEIEKAGGYLKMRADLAKCSSELKLDDCDLYLGSKTEDVDDNEGFFRSGYFWYPANSWCGWHTNSDWSGERVYIVHAAEDNKSFFRWMDPKTGEIKTKWEKKGWQIHKFEIPKDELLWHCVGSYTNRISFGSRQLHNPTDLKFYRELEGSIDKKKEDTVNTWDAWNK